MAVLGGARRLVPAIAAPLPRSAATPAPGLRVQRRPTRVGAILIAIAIAFSGAFVSLSQSVRVAATSYDVVRLTSQRDRLDAQRQELRSDLLRLGGEPAVRKLALDAGLGQLGAPMVVPAR